MPRPSVSKTCEYDDLCFPEPLSPESPSHHTQIQSDTAKMSTFPNVIGPAERNPHQKPQDEFCGAAVQMILKCMWEGKGI